LYKNQIVSFKELARCQTPSPTETFKPIPHDTVLDSVKSALKGASYVVGKQQLAVCKEGQEFFGMLDLLTTVGQTEKLVVGVRNSHNRRFSIGFCVGARTVVCSNLCFSSEILFHTRHTKNGACRYVEGIADAVSQLGKFADVQEERFKILKETTVTSQEAESLILRAGETKLVGWRTIPRVIAEWRDPLHEEHKVTTRYGLLQAFTQGLHQRFQSQPRKAAYETIQLQNFLAS
jgi:hypothetical protein